MAEATASRPFLLLSDDLMWMSRILAATQALGLKLLAARDLNRFTEMLRQHDPCCVILELGSFPVAEAAALAKSLRPQAKLVAYGSHVDAAALAAARAAGCDVALTKGQMAAQLAELLPRWAAA